MAIAPEFTIGLVRPSGLRSTPSSELNARPVAFTPTFRRTASAPSASQASAKTKGFDTLMMVNGCSQSPAGYTRPLVPTTQMPKRSRGARASAGYTWEFWPSVFALKRA